MAPGRELRLARRASDGDAEAWRELISLCGDKIFQLALRFAPDREQAHDLTQEVFLRLFQNLSKYRGDVPLLAWTLRLSKNLCIDHYRRTRAERQATVVSSDLLLSRAASSDPHRDFQRRELQRRIRVALAEMKEDLALVIVLRDLQALSYREISTFLGIPTGTLKSRLSRARKELQRRVSAPSRTVRSTCLDRRSLEASSC